MCLILFALDAHPRYRLVLAANREESFARPATPAAFWDDSPTLLAGRDLEAGGTWLGLTRAGRFAAVTNFHSDESPHAKARSRGELVTDLLAGSGPVGEALTRLESSAGGYNPFSLLAGDADGIWFLSNRNGPPRRVEAGIHGLGNHLLDTPWPKVDKGKRGLATWLADGDAEDPEPLFALLRDTTPAPDDQLPETGHSLAAERALSPIFVSTPGYGTRCSTVIRIERAGRAHFEERTFDDTGAETGVRSYTFALKGRSGGHC